MNPSAAGWFVVLAAFVGANLPFLINQRLLGIVPLKAPKGLPLRLLELLLCYFIVGGMAMLLEQRAGQMAPQGWEFYAVTGALFLTLAFPGFVYRYLYKRHH